MRAVIYQPARNAMQSGTAHTDLWILEFEPQHRKDIDPLMGWTSSPDTQEQVQLRFDTKEQALDYARTNGIEAILRPSQKRKLNIRARGYAENFASDRRAPWTH